MNAKELRAEFIFLCDASADPFPRLRRTPRGRVLPQNDQPAEVRAAWVDFVDACARDGQITERVARNATL